MEVLQKAFGSHNLTSDAEPPELLFVERKEIVGLYSALSKEHDIYAKGTTDRVSLGGRLAMIEELFGDKCLPDKDLEPYTEPETKDNMEEKELNLCELLKGCEGEEFYTLDNGCVVLDEISTNNARGEIIVFLIFHAKNYDSGSIFINPNGKSRKYGEVILFPSRALYEKYPLDPYAAWMEWKSERTSKRWRAKKGEPYWSIDLGLGAILLPEDNSAHDNKRYELGNYFRTKEEAERALAAVWECLAEFSRQLAK